ncbi:hypothetical protein CR513_41963, partial [Mucuna pruriens]
MTEEAKRPHANMPITRNQERSEEQVRMMEEAKKRQEKAERHHEEELKRATEREASLREQLEYVEEGGDEMKGLQAGPFSNFVALSQPASTIEIRARAEKHVEVEEDNEDRLQAQRVISTVRKKNAHGFQANHQYIPGGVSRCKTRVEKFTPIKTSRAHILKEVCHLQLLDIPPPTQHQLGPSKDEWCEFHKTHDHSTKECRLLKS